MYLTGNQHYLICYTCRVAWLEQLCRGHLFPEKCNFCLRDLILQCLDQKICAGATWVIQCNIHFIGVKLYRCLIGNFCAGANRFLKGTTNLETIVDILHIGRHVTNLYIKPCVLGQFGLLS